MRGLGRQHRNRRRSSRFLRFEDLVQEVFEVAVLPGLRFPEIAEHGSDAVNLSYVLPPAELAGAA